MRIEQKIKELNLELPPVPKPLAAYVPATISGALVFTAGQAPIIDDEVKYRGKVGRDLNLEEAYDAAKICTLNCLSAIKAEIVDLDKIEKVVKVVGFVNSADGFTKQPWVLNGASELLIEIFGNRGRHARSAVGVNELPLNVPVEIEMIVEIGNQLNRKPQHK